MLASVARSGSASWQGGALGAPPPAPTKPPSPECLAKPAVRLPTSNFGVDYSDERPTSPFKAVLNGDDVQLVTSWPQGYAGPAIERYPTGESYVGSIADARRHGRGTFMDNEGGTLLSYFENGQPTHEGTRVLADPRSEQLVAALRVHSGKPDGLIDLKEAGTIAKNLGLPMPSKAQCAARPRLTRARLLPICLPRSHRTALPPLVAARARSRPRRTPSSDRPRRRETQPRQLARTTFWIA